MLLQSMQSARPAIVENDAWSGAQEMVEGLGSEALEPFAKPPQGEMPLSSSTICCSSDCLSCAFWCQGV